MEPNLAQDYYQQEQLKNKKPRVWLYWVVLVLVAIAVIIIYQLV